MAAAWPVGTKIPAPMMQPMPSALRGIGPKDRLSSVEVCSSSGSSETTATIACPPAGPGTMAEPLLAVQPPDSSLAKLAILQFSRGGHVVTRKVGEAGLGKIGAAGIAH